MTAQNDLSAFTAKLKRVVGEAAKQKVLVPLAEEAIRLIVKRTRLGYGVGADGDERERLPSLSSRYIALRNAIANGAIPGMALSQYTTPTRSNLTFTGQLLDSMRVIRIAQGRVAIGPTGTRTDPMSRGKTNEQVARYLAQRGRAFNNLSALEQEQLIRFYRRNFGDLLKNERLNSLTRG